MTDPTTEIHPRRALVVRGGWEGHSPVEATERFIPFLREQGFDVRVEGSTAVYADAAAMAATDLIVQCVTMSEIQREELTGLCTAIEAGTASAGFDWMNSAARSGWTSADRLVAA